jgi:ribonuclease I
MPEKVKKAKPEAKPRTKATAARTTAAKKTAIGNRVAEKTPTREEIALLAYHFWTERGGQNGADQQDWYRAERELMSA